MVAGEQSGEWSYRQASPGTRGISKQVKSRQLWKADLPGYETGVDEFAQRRRVPPVTVGGPWNRYDFPAGLELAHKAEGLRLASE
jgi:hypothetical protein